MASKRGSSSSSNWGRAFGIALGSLGLILALASYDANDPSFSTYSQTWHTPQNVLGYFGSWVADSIFQLLGHSAWIVPALLVTALGRWLARKNRDESVLGARWWAGLALVIGATSLATQLMAPTTAVAIDPLAPSAPFPAQGLLGIALGAIIRPFFGSAGSYLVVTVLFWAFCMAWWENLPGYIVKGLGRALEVGSALLARVLPQDGRVGRWTAHLKEFISRRQAARDDQSDEDEEERTKDSRYKPIRINASEAAADDDEDEADESDDETPAPPIRIVRPEKKSATSSSTKSERRTPTDWELPPLSLLDPARRKVNPPSETQLRETAHKIVTALRSFEIEGDIREITPGPIITMYEFQPAPGVRVQKLVSAQTDLAMTLGVPSVRIVAPIPGKSVAGIEVPNPDKEEIVLREVLESTAEKARSMRLPLAMGKDAEGRPVVEDLSRMPHLLIGGATSMGKSVLVNSILTGLLCRFSPDELKLIIIDPKLVEFKAFEDIPHLMLAIVNDPSDASQALKWAVGETRRRYSLLQRFGAKNIDSFNAKVETITEKDLKEGEEKPEKLRYIVIIIDELAELMMTSKRDVEQSIVRLSQLARAAGIHLVMATQRPSAEIVTGLIKSNCPARVALRVASATDSRIVLDCTGAEQLLGKGDMFFTNAGPMGLRRMQGPYLSDGEIDKICDFWRSQGEPDYQEDKILAPEAELEDTESSREGVDALYSEVIEFAREKKSISTSLIQRRFQIGYTRAARIMEQLEARGVVGEAAAAGKARDVIL